MKFEEILPAVRERYYLMEEGLKKDRILLKRKVGVEILEYLIYACISPDDRRKYYN